MKISPLVKAVGIFFLSYLCLLFLLSNVGGAYFKVFQGVFRHQIEFLFPQFHVVDMVMEDHQGQQMISLTVALKENAILPNGTVLHTKGKTFTSKTISINQYLHPIILFSIIAAWPWAPVRTRLILLLLSLPFLLFVEILDIPLLLAIRCEESVQRTIYTNPDAARGFGSYWVAFLHTGGRAALSILAFGLSYGCLQFLRARQQTLSPSPAGTQAKSSPLQKVGRNDPCPCGSGRKFKHCCMKM
jgi:hypothetical protein